MAKRRTTRSYRNYPSAILVLLSALMVFAALAAAMLLIGPGNGALTTAAYPAAPGTIAAPPGPPPGPVPGPAPRPASGSVAGAGTYPASEALAAPPQAAVPVGTSRPPLSPAATPFTAAPAGAPTAATRPPAQAPVTPAAAARPDRRPDEAKRPKRGRLIFVIDDAGHNLRQLEPFLAFPGPITIAVLPGLPYSAEAARLVRLAGKELILHQPMEALNGLDPGPKAIFRSMGEDEIRSLVRANLREISGAVGMNNHMGSSATQDPRLMGIVLDEARRAGIFFLDSVTIGDTVVRTVASLMDYTAWERNVFLDNSPDRESIVRQIDEGLRVADKRGYAVMIGHVWSAELAQTLTELYPGLVAQGYSLSTISRFMMDSFDDDTGD